MGPRQAGFAAPQQISHVKVTLLRPIGLSLQPDFRAPSAAFRRPAATAESHDKSRYFAQEFSSEADEGSMSDERSVKVC
jgi:hypothetical protein